VVTLLHILRFKLIGFLKTTFDFRGVAIVRGLGSLAVFGAFAVGAYFLARNITRFVLVETHTGLYLYHRFISMLLFVFFVAVNLGNIIVSYATLYRSTEVNYLLTKPVSHTSIFVLKFLDNFLYSSTTLFLVALMLLLGYGDYFGYPWYFFAAVMMFVIVPFMFLSACLAVTVLMAIMKIAGRYGFRKVMAGIFAIYFGFIFVFFKVSNPVKLVEDVNRFYPDVDSYLAGLTPGFLNYLPNHWISQFLFFVARGEAAKALPYAGLLLVVTVAAFCVCLVIAKRFYYRSWLVSLQIQSMAAIPYDPHRVGWFDFRAGGILPPQLEVILKREYFTFRREPAQWIHLLVMLVMTALFIFSVGGLNLRLRVTNIQLLTYLVLFAFGGFLTSSLGLRFIFPMVSLEGQAFWLMRSAPVDQRKVYLLKYVIGLVLVVFFAEAVALATNIPFRRFAVGRPLLLWFGLYTSFWVSLAIVSINLAFGGYFSNFSEKNPIRLASSQGATLTFLVALVYMIMTVMFVLVPLSKYFQFLFTFEPFDMRSIVLPGTLVAVLSSLVSGLCLLVGFQSLRKDF
jgi:ABC-2 type transport system permease protein